MVSSTIMDMYIRSKGDKLYDFEVCYFKEKILEYENKIKALLSDEDKELVEHYKFCLLDAFQEKCYYNYCEMLNCGIKIGMELQEYLANLQQ